MLKVRVKKVSKIQEKRIADLIGGKRQPLSGANELHQGDVKSDEYLVEAKMTGKKQISIKSDVLNKICDEAYGRSRKPLLAVS